MRVTTRGSVGQFTSAVGTTKHNGSGSAEGSAACNVKCESCAEMATAAAAPDPKTELERAALSHAQ